jgi:hypothetical protein
MGQIDDITALVTMLQNVAGEMSGTLSWECRDVANRLAKYKKTDTTVGPVAAATNMALDSTTESYTGQEVTFTATLTDGSSAPIEGVTVVFYHYHPGLDSEGSVRYADSSAVTDSSGQATLTTTPEVSADDYTYLAEFLGDYSYEPAINLLTFTVHSELARKKKESSKRKK